MTELETLMQSIAALEAQRAILGDAVVDAATWAGMLAFWRGPGKRSRPWRCWGWWPITRPSGVKQSL